MAERGGEEGEDALLVLAGVGGEGAGVAAAERDPEQLGLAGAASGGADADVEASREARG